MKALVSMSFSPTSIFVVRRLKALGVEVTAVDSHHRSYASYSNAISHRIVAPSMRDDPRGFANCILDELRREHYDLYFPVFECGFLMSFFQEQIRELTHMVTMPFQAILDATNKVKLQALGQSAGVGIIASTFRPGSMSEAQAICQSIDYPVVIKGQSSCNAHGQEIVFDATNLYAVYQRIVAREDWGDSLPLIQRYIRGRLICTVSLSSQGEKIGGVAFAALRTMPVAGGTSTCRETISHPVCEQYDQRLIRALDWTGFISFDYMEDEQTGELFLIDCNPRIAPGAALAYFAGVDLIGAFLSIAAGHNVKPLPSARPGVRSKLHFMDVGWLLTNLQDKQLTRAQKWQCLKQWARRDGSHEDIFSWRDPKPIISLYWYLLRNLRVMMGPKGGEVFYRHALFNERDFNMLK